MIDLKQMKPLPGTDWHWPLPEAVLGLPAYRCYKFVHTKILSREALRILLPDRITSSKRVDYELGCRKLIQPG